MEQNQVAFTQFLGSSRAAGRELRVLYKTAAATPFEVPQITTAARRLLAFGFNAKQANSWLSTIGDTIAGMGGGAQEIDQLVTAIGQIRSKGRLQGDELMQLSELGVVNRGKLAKDLGITRSS
jgi:tape measure domain-containing protein